ncbi:MAG: hypothetical protein EAX86_10450 [Candidatus Heimdallarchaeota archaeon]|nr:hypothetical protein [Candidatus Heimdallarchaeota archaeon]
MGTKILLSFSLIGYHFIGKSFLFDEFYLNKLRSSKQKYDKANENLQGRLILGIWLDVTGIVLLTFLIMNGFQEFVPF